VTVVESVARVIITVLVGGKKLVSARNSNSVPMPVRWNRFSEICSKKKGGTEFFVPIFEEKLNKST
jgi:hypothetical protein